jgi:FtsP/CotA-like multicopper oxidase with cupredoxin domain
MSRRNLVTCVRLVIALCALALGMVPAFAQGNGNNGNGQNKNKTDCTINGKYYKSCPPGHVKQEYRETARLNAAPQTKGVVKRFAGVKAATQSHSSLAPAAGADGHQLKNAGKSLMGISVPPPAVTTMTPGAVPDYFGVGNYANSPLPTLSATGTISGGIRKFVDTLPGLCALGVNDLGQCIPLATPDTTTFPGSDYYRIGLKEYQQQMHRDLPGNTLATKLRGYFDMAASTPVYQYLGPLILATRNRPVRVLFTNMISTDLNIPVDTTYNGAGLINANPAPNLPALSANASQKRATLHLHGGNTPWISDGTTMQWITPVGGDGQPAAPGFAKGFSMFNVPDMIGPGKPIPVPSLTDGMQTFYWTNKQSGRLMFYHDHAFGITRLNVYAGEAAGYLLVDGAQESLLRAATVPGTILTTPSNTPDLSTADLAHRIPLVIQDKTFVPDNGAPGYQLAAQDPTWDVNKYGGLGQLWFPHVYTPNQNPADLTGANGFGRWDWGPWFFPPQNPAGLTAQDFPCSSIAIPTGGTWAFPPLMCPGVPFSGASLSAAAAAAHVPDSPSGVPEGFMDTMVVNGTAYPSLTVDPTGYRFDVLSVGNDRTLNLGLYVAEPLSISIASGGSGYAPPPAAAPVVTITGCTNIASATAVVDLNGNVTDVTVVPTSGLTVSCTAPLTVSIPAPPAPVPPAVATQAYAVASINTEVKMVPAVSVAARTALPNCPTSQEPTMDGGGLVRALLDATGNPLNGTGLPAGCWPLYNSLTGFTAGPVGENGQLSWGNSDGRLGGVPDPTTAGPPIIQIGTEGGLLPAPVVIPSTPVSYDYNKRSITVLNVLNHGLLLGPAERADVIVDFSKFAGKTLILYNDAPAPVPGADPRLDYFTDDPDFSSTGGAPTTMAGYGPNTRTIMQINVNAACISACPPAFSLPILTNGNPAAAPPVPGLSGIFVATQDPINVPEPGYPVANGKGLAEYSRIHDTSLTLNSMGPLCPAGPPCLPKPLLPKAIQELFTLDYGRMNATLGVELPFTNFTIQTTIPYGYADPPTEIFKDGETQLWKITHNGVDTHFIHFHLFNVQVINRVGWDGAVKPPDANELSFKDTVRMNPLEDIIVALKPMTQAPFPFDVPNSIRPLNVTAPIGSTSTVDYTNVDPTNQPAAVVNDWVNFGWEYVWHCHILGHEENDMMRGMILAVAPAVPTLTSAAVAPNRVTLTWTEGSSNYTGFTIQRSKDPTFLTGTTSITVGPTPLTYVDTTVTAGTYYYRVLASNLVGYTRAYAAPAAGYPNVSADSLPSTSLSATLAPKAGVAPASLTFAPRLVGTTSPAQTVTLSNTGTASLAITSITITGTNPGDFARTTTCGASLAVGATCAINVTFTPTGINARSASLTIVSNDPVSPTLVPLSGTGNGPVLSLSTTALTFSSPMNVTSAAQTVTVTNTGNATLTINPFTLTGANPFQFNRTDTCGATLAAGATCTISVTFRPTAAAPLIKTASVNVNVAAPATSQSISVTGNIIVPTFTAGPAINFGNRSVAAGNSAAQTVTLTNTSQAPVTGLNYTFTGANPGQFNRAPGAAGGTCGATLAVGASCTIGVRFNPSSAGLKTATLNTNPAAPAANVTVALSGTGTLP